MDRKFMDGIWKRVEQLEQAEALLSTAEQPKRLPHRPIVMAAVIAAVLGLLACTASLTARYQEFLPGPQSAYLDQDITVIDQGIEVHTLTAFADSSSMELLFTVRDLEGDRLSGDYPGFEINWEGSAADHDWGDTSGYGLVMLDYDENKHQWLIKADISTSATTSFDGLIMHLTELRMNNSLKSSLYPLSELPLNEHIPAPQGTLPEGAGVTFDQIELTKEGLIISYTEEDASGTLQYHDRNNTWRTTLNLQGQPEDHFSYHKENNVYRFPDITEADLQKGLTLQITYRYYEPPITGDWVLPIRTKTLDERVVHPENLDINGNPVVEIVISNAVVRILTEQPQMQDEDDESNIFYIAEDNGLRIHLKNGTILQAEAGSSIGWSSNVYASPDADEPINYCLYKWTLSEMLDPEQVTAIECLDNVLPLN